jgi:hypothetical protein
MISLASAQAAVISPLSAFKHGTCFTRSSHLLQLNIFLAILIEGYSAVKEISVDTGGVGSDVHYILQHEFYRVRHLLFGEPFFSDEQLAATLSRKIHQSLTMDRSLQDLNDIILGHNLQVDEYTLGFDDDTNKLFGKQPQKTFTRNTVKVMLAGGHACGSSEPACQTRAAGRSPSIYLSQIKILRRLPENK